METRREQALVGLFVIVAAAVLIATVFGITGAFGRTAKSFHAFFPFAGGLRVGFTGERQIHSPPPSVLRGDGGGIYGAIRGRAESRARGEVTHRSSKPREH